MVILKQYQLTYHIPSQYLTRHFLEISHHSVHFPLLAHTTQGRLYIAQLPLLHLNMAWNGQFMYLTIAFLTLYPYTLYVSFWPDSITKTFPCCWIFSYGVSTYFSIPRIDKGWISINLIMDFSLNIYFDSIHLYFLSFIIIP